MPKSATSPLKGLAKSHRIALSPTDRQATLMMEHAGWARVAANWARDEFRRAWFTGEGEPNEWLSDRDLRKRFNAVKREAFPWSRKLSQNVAKNAIIHMGRVLPGPETRTSAPQDRISAGPQAAPQARLPAVQRPQQHPGGRVQCASAQDRTGAHARGIAVRGRHHGRHG